MSSDAELRPVKAVRGLIVSTGEEAPRGGSLRARALHLEIGRADMNWKLLTAAQCDAAEGHYAAALSGYVQWFAKDYRRYSLELPRLVDRLRTSLTVPGLHPRTPLIVAELAAGLAYFLAYAVHAGAVAGIEADLLWTRGWGALVEACCAQAQPDAQSPDPAKRFISLLSASVAGGNAGLANPNGDPPPDAESAGWRRTPSGDLAAPGRLIGWLNQDNLFLDPDEAVAEAHAFSGGKFSPTVGQIGPWLRQAGLLASTGETEDRIQVRRTLAGKRRRVLHLALTTFRGQADRSDRPDPDAVATPPRPRVPGPIGKRLDDQRKSNAGTTSSGPFGPKGPRRQTEAGAPFEQLQLDAEAPARTAGPSQDETE